jgi:adenine/guanine/hypoxanthine permease
VAGASTGGGLRLVKGDVNGFLALSVDNLSVLALLAGMLVRGFGVPASIVFGRMIPGTAFGVLAGDLCYTWLGLRLARRTGRSDVTAMPFGLDTPSTIGMGLLVLGPAFARLRAAGLDPQAAGLQVWHLGMAATVIMGSLKLPLAFAGRRLGRLFPQAGLLGSLAGIALLLIGFLPLVELMQEPVAGFLTLGLVLYALVARGAVPGRLPGVLFAVLAGTAVHYAMRFAHLDGALDAVAAAPFALHWPRPDARLLDGFAAAAAQWPLLIPFALLTVIGGVNNTASAAVAGDSYDVRSVLLAEAASTIVAGLFGGVAQTTPYIGHPAYKEMGARTGYTLLTGLFIGVGGVLGVISQLLQWIPLAALAPVLLFVALDITAQAYRCVPARHAVAVAFAFFPAIARLVAIELGDPRFVEPARFAQALAAPAAGLPALAVIVALGNGFIVTSTLWAAFVVELVERRVRAAAAYIASGAVLCAFGVIHSVRADGSVYLPWTLRGAELATCAHFCAAYLTLAGALAVLSSRALR